MSSNNTTTLSVRVGALESDVKDIKASVLTLVETLTGKPAKASKKAAPAKIKRDERGIQVSSKARTTGARKTPNRKPVVNGTVAGARCLTKANRAQFLADHDWTKGLPAEQRSTAALARLVIEEGQPLVGSWAIGPRRAEQITGKAQPVTGPAVKAGKKGKKGKKGKGTKTTVQAVVEVAAPAKTLTPAQQERVDAPRDAKGRVTPKVEWALREALALSGKFGRDEIDERVLAAREAGVFA